MSIDKVQLQQQEVINNETVLTDINPITSTDSIFDISTGSTMQETLDRLWNAINSKLARNVNSVNNRSGVVVLDSNDVGLGNVDNVSFNDIKTWVIEFFTNKMKNYRFRLFDSMQEVVELANTNDESLDGVPFYSQAGFSPDLIAYIGYFYWDSEQSILNHVEKPIKVIGEADNSIIYNEPVGSKDYRGGKIGINIHPDETALYVENGPTKAQSGLRLNQDALSHQMLNSPCLYGAVDATNAMLSANDSSDGTPIIIYVDDVLITSDHGHHLHKDWSETLHMFSLVKTSFDAFYTRDTYGAPIVNGPRASLDLMDRQPAIGVVTAIPNDISNTYEIRFYSIKTFTNGFGLTYYDNHQTTAEDSQLGIDFATNSKLGNMSGLQAKGTGLRIDNAYGDLLDTNSDNLAYRITTPNGWNFGGSDGDVSHHGIIIATDDSICRYPVHLFNPASRIPTGESATYDQDTYKDSLDNTYFYGSKLVDNWSPLSFNGFDVSYVGNGELSPDKNSNGYPGSTSYLSINLNKLVRDTGYTLLLSEPEDWSTNYTNYYYVEQISETDNDFIYKKIPEVMSAPEWDAGKFYKKYSTISVDDAEVSTMPRYHFTNLSGLRLTHRSLGRSGVHDGTRYATLEQNELEALGIYDGKDSVGNELTFYPFNNFSGGLSVNVGNYLEICPKETGRGEEYDDSGKVQVRIGAGLTDDFTIEEVDLSQYDMIHHPDDYYTNPERYKKLKNGELIDLGEGYYRLDTQPYDWTTNWDNYYIEKYGRFWPLERPMEFEPNRYYAYGQESWQDIYVSIHQAFEYDALIYLHRTNRFKVNVDNTTITINEDNQLTVAAAPTVEIDDKTIKLDGNDALEVNIDNNTIQYDSSNCVHVPIDDQTIKMDSSVLKVNIDNSTIKKDDSSNALKVNIDESTIVLNGEGKLSAVGGGGGGSDISVDNTTITKNSNNIISVNYGNTLWVHEDQTTHQTKLDVDYDSNTMCISNNELAVNYDPQTLCITGDTNKLSVYRSNIIDNRSIRTVVIDNVDRFKAFPIVTEYAANAEYIRGQLIGTKNDSDIHLSYTHIYIALKDYKASGTPTDDVAAYNLQLLITL